MNGGDQNFGVFSGSDPVISLAPATPQKPKKRFLFPVVVIILLIVILFGALIVFKTQSTPNSESYQTLRAFYSDSSYQDLVDLYDLGVGLQPNLKADAVTPLFPISQSLLEDLKNRLSAVEESFKTLPGSISLKSDLETSLSNLRYNINLLSDFFDAFVDPIYKAHSGEITVSCEKSSAINELFSSAPSAADAYFNLYCETIKVGVKKSAKIIKESTREAYEIAVASLNSTLKTVEDLRPKIETLLTEAEK